MSNNIEIMEEGDNKLILKFTTKNHRHQWRSLIENIKIEAYIDERTFTSYSFVQLYFLDAEKDNTTLFNEFKKRLVDYIKWLDGQAEDYPKMFLVDDNEKFVCYNLIRNKLRSLPKKDEDIRFSLPATYFDTNIYVYKTEKNVSLLVTNHNNYNKTAIERLINFLSISVVNGNTRYLDFKKDLPNIALKFDRLRGIKFDPHYKIPKEVEEKIKKEYGTDIEISFSNEIKIEKDDSKTIDLNSIPEVKTLLQEMGKRTDEGIMILEGKKGGVTTRILNEAGTPMKIICWPMKKEVSALGELEYLLTFSDKLKLDKKFIEDVQTRTTQFFS